MFTFFLLLSGLASACLASRNYSLPPEALDADPQKAVSVAENSRVPQVTATYMCFFAPPPRADRRALRIAATAAADRSFMGARYSLQINRWPELAALKTGPNHPRR
jgi:hypothetical protein